MAEFYRLGKIKNLVLPKFLGIFTGVVLFVSNYFFANNLVNAKIFFIFIPLILILFIIELYRTNEQPFNNISYTILGIIYLAFPFSLFNYFVHIPDIDNQVTFTPQILLGFFFITWANDTGAYLVGSTIGKKRLFERVSPKKSWEGSIGGGIFAIIIAYILSIFYTNLNVFDWLCIASIIVIMGTYGDLVESAYKRSLNVKDSGSILPGHGGILDRFDSMLLSAPMVFIYLEISKLF